MLFFIIMIKPVGQQGLREREKRIAVFGFTGNSIIFHFPNMEKTIPEIFQEDSLKYFRKFSETFESFFRKLQGDFRMFLGKTPHRDCRKNFLGKPPMETSGSFFRSIFANLTFPIRNHRKSKIRLVREKDFKTSEANEIFRESKKSLKKL